MDSFILQYLQKKVEYLLKLYNSLENLPRTMILGTSLTKVQKIFAIIIHVDISKQSNVAGCLMSNLILAVILTCLASLSKIQKCLLPCLAWLKTVIPVQFFCLLDGQEYFMEPVLVGKWSRP